MELLSPAGNLEILKGVVNAGADAVYFGADKFGARAYAMNFTDQEGAEGIEYAHLHGVKTYLTVNTLLKNTEISRELYEKIETYCRAGIDAVLVQDLGVASFLHWYFPQLPLHASTQMTIASAYGANLMKEFGMERIVLPRELSLNEMREIKQGYNGQIEVFVHGALCMCYSGKCLMSSLLGGRSGNRGRCAQTCRLPYELLDEKGKKIMVEGAYLLSPRDLCGIEDLPQLFAAGVDSLKIEGRMKQFEYAVNVVSVYRNAIDRFLDNPKGFSISKQEMNRLDRLGSRGGFTDLYFYEKNGKGLVNYRDSSHHNSPLTDPLLPLEKKIPVDGAFFFKKDQPMSFTLEKEEFKVTVTGDIPEGAIKSAVDETAIRTRLMKINDTGFCYRTLDVEADPGLFVPMGKLNDMKRQAFARLKQELLPDQRWIRPFSETPEDLRPLQESDFPRLLITVKNPGQLKAAEDYLIDHMDMDHRIASDQPLLAISLEMAMNAQWKAENAGRYALAFPNLLRTEDYKKILINREHIGLNAFAYYICDSLDQIAFLLEESIPAGKIIAGPMIYSMNDPAVAYLRGLNVCAMTAPYELNSKELKHRDNADSYLTLYGYLPLMTTANCTNKNISGCDHQAHCLSLRDRKQEDFPVRNYCEFCYNQIYNSRPLKLYDLKKEVEPLGFAGYRIDFTIESAVETTGILEEYFNNRPASGDYTRGHFHRGIE